MSALSGLFSASVAAQTIRVGVPYIAAASGGVWSERAGVVNIALEGTMLVGAFASVVAHLATGSPWLGLGAGVLAGVAFAALHAAVNVYGRVDGIVAGITFNLLAASGTRAALRGIYGSSANSPTITGFRFLEGDGAALAILRAVLDPETVLTLAFLGASLYVLGYTAFGLRVRAAGESPAVLRSTGVSVPRVRMMAACIGGALAGLGGVALAFDQHQFQAGMTGGRGFIALAAVVLSGWNIRRAALACVAFAVLDAAQVALQNQGGAPPALLSTLPYVAAMVALVVVLRRGRGTGAPAGLGIHADP
jgi:ABC-type uncharacterized transport system permease subunit